MLLDLHYQNNKSEKYGGFCKADHRHKASVLEGHDLLFVHCVSSEPTLLVPMGYRVFSFALPEIWDKMATDMRTLTKYGGQILL